MKRLAFVVGSLVLGVPLFAQTTTTAQEPKTALTSDLKLSAIKSVEVVEWDGVYHALVTVVFENQGSRAYRVLSEKSSIKVSFEIEGGIKYGPPVWERVTEIVDGKELVKHVMKRQPKPAEPAALGTAPLPESMTLEPVARMKKDPVHPGEKTLDFVLGTSGSRATEEKMARIANILGDWQRKQVSRVSVEAMVMVEESPGRFISRSEPLRIEMEMRPQYTPDALFK